MNESLELAAVLPDTAAGKRLDRALADAFPDYSRSRLQHWLKKGAVTVDGCAWRARDRVAGGERVCVRGQLPDAAPTVVAEPLALDRIHEDDDLLVVNKPPGLVVHPGAGNSGGTLQNALLHHYPHLAGLPRCGLVHRIDKDTSGLLVVALSERGHAALTQQIQDKTLVREYDALVAGRVTAGDRIEAPIGRHPRDRKRMAVVADGRPAVSHYRVRERFSAHTLLRVFLETGRTHQVRVHLAHRRYPLVGDPVYGHRPRLPKGADDSLRTALGGLGRQALHAARLALIHPTSGETVSWEAPRPTDLEDVLAALRAHEQRMTA